MRKFDLFSTGKPFLTSLMGCQAKIKDKMTQLQDLYRERVQLS